MIQLKSRKLPDTVYRCRFRYEKGQFFSWTLESLELELKLVGIVFPGQRQLTTNKGTFESAMIWLAGL